MSPPPPPPPPPVASNPTTTEQLQDLVMPYLSMAQNFAQTLSQNINSQLVPTKQEAAQSTSTTPVPQSKPEPKKAAPVKDEPSQPLYQPAPKYDYKPSDYYIPVAKPVPTIPAPNPIRIPSAETKYENELKKLKEFGFYDTQLMLDLLKENNGDIDQVLEDILDV